MISFANIVKVSQSRSQPREFVIQVESRSDMPAIYQRFRCDTKEVCDQWCNEIKYHIGIIKNLFSNKMISLKPVGDNDQRPVYLPFVVKDPQKIQRRLSRHSLNSQAIIDIINRNSNRSNHNKQRNLYNNKFCFCFVSLCLSFVFMCQLFDFYCGFLHKLA